ncbi:MAG TPA: molybdopterin converting factor subunit 1 [Chloroflexia bacterium]|nr:molybdopterin converting factor subunit 1 [Chloroflexia bacterium]
MKVTIRLFASFREAVGTSESATQVEPGTTVAQLWDALQTQYPPMRPPGSVFPFALNCHYATPATPLSEGDVVAFIPPVSGG